MEVTYELTHNDYGVFLAFQKLQSVAMKRQKVVMRWIICMVLLMILPVFHLDQEVISIVIILGLCAGWLMISGLFMNHIVVKKTCKMASKVKLPFMTMHISLNDCEIKVDQNQKEKQYAYQDITHVIKFQGIMIVTLKSKEILLVPRHAFASSQDWKYFFVTLMQKCGCL